MSLHVRICVPFTSVPAARDRLTMSAEGLCLMSLVPVGTNLITHKPSAIMVRLSPVTLALEVTGIRFCCVAEQMGIHTCMYMYYFIYKKG